MSVHESHPDIIKRLKRAEGHLRRIISMMEEGRACLDVAQQLKAVESAIVIAKKQLIHDHVDHCLEHALNESGADITDTMTEFKQIMQYL